jgi:hypothetical protein
MKWLRKWTGREKETSSPARPAESEDILATARKMEGIIDQVASRVFVEFKSDLINEKITFIIPAVWGAAKDADLTPVQARIHQMIAEPMLEVLSQIDLERLEPSQSFAVSYIVRSLMVSKIVYMIEASKRQLAEYQRQNEDDAQNPLAGSKPMGRA